MPGAGPAQLPGLGVEHQAQRGAAAGTFDVVSEPVQPRQRGGRGVSVEQVGGQRAAQLPHHRGSRGALPDDIPHHDSDLVFVEN